MKIHPNPVLTQPVLILLLILLVAGTNPYLLTEAQNNATTMISVNNASSSTNRPMNNTIDSTLPKLGMIDAKIKCSQLAKMDFSLKREIFFVVLDALLGDIIMMLPGTIYGLFYENGNYYTIWIIFGLVIGVYSNFTILSGNAIHFLTAFSIGIVLGIFLYKTGILEISNL